MTLFGGVISIKEVTFLLFMVFVITFIGYLLGRINIKGIDLGTAGVFIIALLFGALFSDTIASTLTHTVNGEKVNIATTALKIVDNIGLVLFVGSVGLIAGPSFFKNFKKNFKSYILIGLIIIVSGAIATIICFYIGRGAENSDQEFIAMLTGIMSGSLTSTPAFSSAKMTAASVAAGSGSVISVADAEAVVSVGYGIAYIFGVVGVVLFVQLIPKLTHANMDEEREKIRMVDTGGKNMVKGRRFEADPFGYCAFAFVMVCGILLGAVKVPLSSAGLSGTTFSLTSTGGVLLCGLIFGHFGHIGPFAMNIKAETLKSFREFGLVLFLIGAGVSGGMKFVQYFKWIYFLYGIIITILPMILGYLFSRYVLKLSLLNCLGSITGGMTSTPALGTLISTAGTDEVASSYAATYPIALIAVVLSSQFLILIFS